MLRTARSILRGLDPATDVPLLLVLVSFALTVRVWGTGELPALPLALVNDGGPVPDRRGLTCDLLFGQYGTFPIDRAQRLFIHHIETDTLRYGCLREFHRGHLTQSEVAAACGAIALCL